jgi:hypothetical protein
MTNS